MMHGYRIRGGTEAQSPVFSDAAPTAVGAEER